MSLAMGTEASLATPRGRRYALVPQMRDYDALDEKRWLPYVMFFHQPNQKTPSFTTDEHGFRGTLWQDQPLTLKTYNEGDHPRGALVGSSSAFGIGASSDGATLASQLNRKGSTAWFNFSGRAFNSTQEVIIFLLHLPKDVAQVVLFTGINHLVLSHLAGSASPVYNAFYYQSIFEQGLKRGKMTGVRGSFQQFAQEVAQKFVPGKSDSPSRSSEERYDDGLACMERDLRIWALLQKSLGFKLYFVLQPAIPWLNKALVPEEEELFGCLNQIGTEYNKTLFSFLAQRKDQFQADAKRLCDQFEVPFLDLNGSDPFKQPQWLFVDRIHLTDAGFALAAELIRKEFSL